jgi:NADP-dependent 3-hydroxy acid dehydrogenase YdfG
MPDPFQTAVVTGASRGFGRAIAAVPGSDPENLVSGAGLHPVS